MEYKVDLIKFPIEEYWEYCKVCTLNTVGKKLINKNITSEWKRKILASEHSPIRDGYFIWSGHIGTGDFTIKINNIIVGQMGHSYDDLNGGVIPASKGDTISWSATANLREINVNFYPCKGGK